MAGCIRFNVADTIYILQSPDLNFLAIPASNIEQIAWQHQWLTRAFDQLQSHPGQGDSGLVVQTQHQRIVAINSADVPPYKRMSLNDFIILSIMPPNSCY